MDRQATAESGAGDLKRGKVKMEQEKEELKKKLREVEAGLKRVESERAAKEGLLRQLDGDRQTQV